MGCGRCPGPGLLSNPACSLWSLVGATTPGTVATLRGEKGSSATRTTRDEANLGMRSHEDPTAGGLGRPRVQCPRPPTLAVPRSARPHSKAADLRLCVTAKHQVV